MQALAYFDGQTINLIELVRTPFLNKFFIFISYLGAVDLVLFFAFAVTIFLLIKKKRIKIRALWISLAGSVLSAYFLKLAVHRPRPLIGIVKETSFSFPSAHSVLSLAFYGFIIYLVFQSDKNRLFKLTTFLFLLILIVLIGFSRIYLGVHFLSDVLAGYLLGGLWLLIGIKSTKIKD